MKIAINGITRECTPEEEAKILDERKKVSILVKPYGENVVEHKNSGKTKLKNLGLTDEEINALMGK